MPVQVRPLVPFSFYLLRRETINRPWVGFFVPERNWIGTPKARRPSVGPIKARPLVPFSYYLLRRETINRPLSRFFCVIKTIFLKFSKLSCPLEWIQLFNKPRFLKPRPFKTHFLIFTLLSHQGRCIAAKSELVTNGREGGTLCFPHSFFSCMKCIRIFRCLFKGKNIKVTREK